MAGGIVSGGRARGRGRRRRRGAVSEINVTPLVDVMLVLLIIFMVSAPLLTSGVQVNLPKVATPVAQQSQEKALTVSIEKTGQIYLDDSPETLESLEAKLRQTASVTPERPVNVRAAQEVDYGRFAQVAGIVSRAGVKSMALQFDPAQGR